MTLSTILTITNIIGGGTAAYSLLLTTHNYIIGRKMGFYIFLLFATMSMLVFSQFYMLSYGIESNWRLKLIGVFYWGKAIYFSWAIRYSCIKK